MEEGIVTAFASIVTVLVVLAIVLGLGRKYHDEDLKAKKSSLNKSYFIYFV